MTLRSVRRHPGSGPDRDVPVSPPRPMAGRPAARRARAYAGAISAVIAAACYSSFLLSPWTHAAASAGNGFISELEDPGRPFAWLYRGSDVLAGLGVLTAAWMTGRVVAGGRRVAAGLVLLALTGISSLLDAATSMQCDPGVSARCAQQEHTAGGLTSQLLVLHTDSGLLGFLGSAAGAAVLGAALAGRWRGWGRLQFGLGAAIAGCGLADVILLLTGNSIGATERVRVLLTSGCFLAVGIFLLREGRPRRVELRG
jgi:hypothetical protein